MQTELAVHTAHDVHRRFHTPRAGNTIIMKKNSSSVPNCSRTENLSIQHFGTEQLMMVKTKQKKKGEEIDFALFFSSDFFVSVNERANTLLNWCVCAPWRVAWLQTHTHSHVRHPNRHTRPQGAQPSTFIFFALFISFSMKYSLNSFTLSRNDGLHRPVCISSVKLNK